MAKIWQMALRASTLALVAIAAATWMGVDTHRARPLLFVLVTFCVGSLGASTAYAKARG